MGRKSKNIIQKLPKVLQVGLLILAASFFLVLTVCLLFHFAFWQKIYPGIKVANLDLTGKTSVQASKILEQEISLREVNVLRLNYQDQTWAVSLADLKFNYFPSTTSRQAYLIGRSGNFPEDIKQKLKGLRKEINLDLDYQLDQLSLEKTIASISAQINVPSIPPTIQLIKENNYSSIQIQTGEPGKKVEEDKLKQLIDQHLAQMLELSLTLPVEELLPQTTQEQAEITKQRGEKLLGKNLVLSFAENSWQLDEAELINFLDFSGGFDQEKIASFTAQLAQSIDRSPQNALFNFQNGRVTEFKPAKNGQALDQEQTQQVLTQALEDLEEKEEKKASLSLNVKLTEPAVANEDVNSLGIRELVGRGESWFSGSIASRIHNIQLASSRINGLLIAPGETFSLNQALGDVSLQTGFKEAWVIKEGRTVLGDGGGVCQVSTTLFRAALKAGLPIVERRAHAYRVGYYEQNYQVGVDATVFAPSPDFKFTNDTPGHLLIQMTVDTAKMKLTYDLYGTADGRQVHLSPSRLWDQTPPPPDLYQDDPTLPAGVVKQIDWAAWGAKTAFDWKVTRGNEVLQERTFYSSYSPWQAVFLRGTGGQ
jgi:vancomycin resistance protein YoaR